MKAIITLIQNCGIKALFIRDLLSNQEMEDEFDLFGDFDEFGNPLNNDFEDDEQEEDVSKS